MDIQTGGEMRALVTVIIIALLSWLGSWYIAWWIVAIVPFLMMLLIKPKAGKGFILGFSGIALLWLYLVLKQDIANEQILSNRMAVLIGLPHTVLLIVNVLLGALVGGLGGWSGALTARVFNKKN